MSDGVEVQITGLEELRTTLQGVSYDTQRKGGRYALRKAAQVIRDKARQNASRLDDPATAEDISKNIVERWDGRRFKRTGDLAFRIGVLGGAKQYANTKANVRAGRAGDTYKTDGDKTNPGGDTFYWRFLEFGTEHSAAQPFMRPAAEESVNQVVNTFVTEFDRHVERAIKRHAKKGTQA